MKLGLADASLPVRDLSVAARDVIRVNLGGLSVAARYLWNAQGHGALNGRKTLVGNDLVPYVAMVLNARQFWQRRVVAVVHLLPTVNVLDVSSVLRRQT